MSWYMICKDGKRRHLGYHSQDDCAFDAHWYDDHNLPCEEDCPGGPHTIEEIGVLPCCRLSEGEEDGVSEDSVDL